ncbi:YhgE/Pip domain-containing protein [Naasia lichenicola]|uniref:YhgE/Pip domain-containing protein n=1 Tax=Naasia lichenicola TaxID=2565933 RepID=A0A4S4FHN9_9MICO|nr:YhgE/Pip domain-containing protein [Naasia lichenicola]THG29538.1 YhgE/Pip domain-containing protein [Naasia lichenicola]
MSAITLVRAELARVTSTRLGRAALGAIMLVPVLYGGLYLWGNQDPYANLDKVPAAIVVDDSGTSDAHYGQDVADELIDDGTFGWVIVNSDATAHSGVEDGTYAFALTFPESFSADLTSADSDSPSTAQMVLTTDDTNSYLSTTLAKQAATTARNALASTVAKQASQTLLEAVDQVRTGLVDAGSGASSLADGAASAADGASALASGTSDLSAGAVSLRDGLDQLEGEVATLPDSTSSLAAGAGQVASGVATAADSASALSAGTAQIASSAPQLRAQIAAAFTAAGVPSSQSAPLLAGLDSLSSAAAQTSAGSSALSSGLGTLTSASAQVATGADRLDSAAADLSSAVSAADAGAVGLADGAAQLQSGAASLSDGTAQLADGSSRLDSSLANGVAQVPATTAGDRATTAAAIADPVEVEQVAITEAQNYGAGLAPFFITLAAWIGIYAIFLIIRPLSREALTAARRPIRTALAGWLTPAMLGAVEMVIVFLVATLGLHLEPANAVGLLGFMLLVSLTFAAIVLALNVWLGGAGQFVALILMIVQLVTAGGTFPWQTLPAPLAALHSALPMSYSVSGIRQLLYGGTSQAVLAAVVPLVLWLVGALVVVVVGAAKQATFRTLGNLQPSPIGGN